MQELGLFRNLYISAKLWLSIIVLVLVASVLAVDEHSAYADQTPSTLPQSSDPQPELPEKPTLPGTAHTMKATVTVRYVDQQGKRLHTNVILHGNVGEPYKAAAVTVEGYMLYDVPQNIKGVFLEQPQTVTYVYQTETVPDSTVPDSDEGTVVTSGAAAIGSDLPPAKERSSHPSHVVPRPPARHATAKPATRARRGHSVAKVVRPSSVSQRQVSRQKQTAEAQHHGSATAKAVMPKRMAFHKHYIWQSLFFWWLIGGVIVGIWSFLAYRRHRKDQEE